MIRRLGPGDLEQVEDLFNTPEVFESIKDDVMQVPGDIDIPGLLAHPKVYFMTYDDKGYGLFIPKNRRVYYVHVFAKKEHRDRGLVDRARKVIGYIYENTGCEKLLGFIPIKNKPSIAFAAMVGFRQIGPFHAPGGDEMIVEHGPEDL